jgi:hypothetical protein
MPLNYVEVAKGWSVPPSFLGNYILRIDDLNHNTSA